MHEHFLQDNHHGFFNNPQVTLIDKTQVSCPTKREYFGMRTLKLYYPYGLKFDILVLATMKDFCTILYDFLRH